ncbi:MAG: hypothetical protein ACP5FL_03905 [Thermoplasmatota archaeon]
MSPTEEMDKVVEACSKAREAKTRTKMKLLHREKTGKWPPEHYEDEKSCREAGYYWYGGECHREPRPEESSKEEPEPSEQSKPAESSEEEKPAPDECGTKEKCLRYGYQWDPETGCKHPEEAPSQQPEE